jgi:MFS family permease
LEEFQWSRALTSSIQSVQFTTTGVFMFLAGYLVDRYSARVVIGFGAVLISGGLILSSLTGEIWHIYLFLGFVVGMGMSAMYLPAVTVVTRWFTKKRGLVLGIAVSGFGIGGFLGSPFLNWLVQSFGWRMALLVLGVCLGCVLFIAVLILRGHPEEKNLKSYGADEASEEGDYSESSQIRNNHNPPLGRCNNSDWTVWQAMRTQAFLILSFMYFLATIPVLGVIGHLFSYATEQGVSGPLVSWAYSVIGITSLFGKIAVGAFSDRIGRKAAFLLCFSLQGSAFIVLLAGCNILSLYLFAAIFGVSYGGWSPLFPAALVDFFGPQSMGKIFPLRRLVRFSVV